MYRYHVSNRWVTRMVYGIVDEALPLFSRLKIGSGEVNQDWDKFKYKKSKYKKNLLPWEV